MLWHRISQIFCILSVLIISGANAREPKPLFADDDVISLRIEAPFGDLIRSAPKAKTAFTATLALKGAASEQHTISLSPRGRSRRQSDICKFPPLRVAFDVKPEDGSLFDGQKGLKLVTHCRRSNSYQQYILNEYNAYRLFNLMTPESLRVRMAEIDYVDSRNGKLLFTKSAFFIEDTDDAAKRNQVKEIDVKEVSVLQLDPKAAAYYALFQYMVSNYDWSMYRSISDDDCCHNTKLIGKRDEPLSALVPVPYDFDHSGLVDAPYAVVPENVPVRNVRNRRYRGFCSHNEKVIAAAAEILNNRTAFEAVIENTPRMKGRLKKKSKQFLEGFFDNIKDRETVEKKLLKTCRD